MYHRQPLLKAWARRGGVLQDIFGWKQNTKEVVFKTLLWSRCGHITLQHFLKGSALRPAPVVQKCHKIRQIFSNAHITLLITSSLFLLFCSPPPPMSTACHYRKLQLICPHSWKWIIGRRPIIKHSSHAWSFLAFNTLTCSYLHFWL